MTCDCILCAHRDFLEIYEVISMTYDGVKVGENIRNFRLKNDMTLEEVAFEVNKSASHLSQIEQGHRGISIQLLYSLMKLFKVDANTILGIKVGDKADLLDYAVNELPEDKREMARKMIVGILQLVFSI